jgi:hypothetical protein
LFRVSDQEQLPRPQTLFGPGFIGDIFAAQQEQDLGLQRIRVLKFIN